MIIVGVAAYRCGKWLRGDDLGQALIVLDECGGGGAGGVGAMRTYGLGADCQGGAM